MKTYIGSEIELAANFLKKGEPVVFPTETVYGLGAPVFHREAVLKIFTIKNRPSDNPLIVHIGKIEDLSELCSDPPPLFWTLIESFWPGPLTLILKRSPKVSAIVSGGLETIAIRMPSHAIARKLIEAVGEPLAAPSANLSGRPSATNALDAYEDLQGRIPMILDGGDCPIGIESTAISLIGETPGLLRPGAISAEEIEEVIQMPLHAVDRPLSPGMKYRHYAPRAKVKLVMRKEDLKGSFILSLDPGPGVRLLTPHTLYAEFRKADRLGEKLIEIDCTPSLMANSSLMNRLIKAAKNDDQSP